jgi:valyl-tRNA synthetase
MVPPNLTGDLHLGHALMVSVQDALVRVHRQLGRTGVYVPGVDHAGLAMHALVVGDPEFRSDLSLPRRLTAWASANRRTIRAQLRRLELSCSWKLETYTLSPRYVGLVHATFRQLARDGLLSRGRRVVNWCPTCATTISDLETELSPVATSEVVLHARVAGRVRPVPLARPELLWGAVAVTMPGLAGAEAELVQLSGRRLPVVSDARMGTEPRLLVPAHDPLHERIARDHRLPIRDVFDESGRSLLAEAPGLTADELRDWTVAMLGLRSIPGSRDAHRCARCGSELLSRRSWQWFLRMRPIVEPVLDAVRAGNIDFDPAAVGDEVRDWLERADEWCLSRQVRWGPRIPAYRCRRCEGWATEAGRCSRCGTPLARERDVLDTWFGCALWPLASTRWPAQELYPAAVLTTGRDIVFFWLVRSLVLCRYVSGSLPARSCFVHGLVLDAEGRKMSKSVGNTVTVAEGVTRYGADAVRAGLLSRCRGAQDFRLDAVPFRRQQAIAETLEALARFRRLRGAGLPDGLEHWALAEAMELRMPLAQALTEYRFADAVRALDGYATRVLATVVEVRRRQAEAENGGCPSASAALMAEVAALFEPVMPGAAGRLAAGTARAPAIVPDSSHAGAAGCLVEVLADLRRLRGAVGLNAHAPVRLTPAAGTPDPRPSERWALHVTGLRLELGPPTDGAVAWLVPGHDCAALHLPPAYAGRAREEARRRLRVESRSRRLLAARLRQAGAGPLEVRTALEARMAAIEGRIAALRRNLDACARAVG